MKFQVVHVPGKRQDLQKEDKGKPRRVVRRVQGCNCEAFPFCEHAPNATKTTASIEAENLLFCKAVHTDGFRLWFYPWLPKSYGINPDVAEEIEAGLLAGKSATQIADEIYKKHSCAEQIIDETRWPICPECLASLDTPETTKQCPVCGLAFGTPEEGEGEDTVTCPKCHGIVRPGESCGCGETQR